MVDTAALRRGQRALQLERDRVAEIKPLVGLGYDDGFLAVGRPVHVVGVVDRGVLARLAGQRIDRREAAVAPALGVVGDVERAQVPRRHDVLRVDADREGGEHLQRLGVDHRDRVGAPVGHVDAHQRAGHGGAHAAARGLAVEVVAIGHRRHAGHGDNGARGRDCRRRSCCRPARCRSARRLLRHGPPGRAAENQQPRGEGQPHRLLHAFAACRFVEPAIIERWPGGSRPRPSRP